MNIERGKTALTQGRKGTRNAVSTKGSWAKMPYTISKKKKTTTTTTATTSTATVTADTTDKTAATVTADTTDTTAATLQGPVDLVVLAARENNTTSSAASSDPNSCWNVEVWALVCNIFVLTGGIASVIQLVLWIRQACQANGGDANTRKTQSKRIHDTLDAGRGMYTALAIEKSHPLPDVDLKKAGHNATADTVQHINQYLNDHTPNYDTATVDSITTQTPLRQTAETALKASLESYVRSHISATMRANIAKLSYLDYFDTVLKDTLAHEVALYVDPKLAEIKKAANPFDPIIHSVVLAARHSYYAADYKAKETAYKGAAQDYEDAVKARKAIQEAIEKIEQEIKEDQATQDKNKEAEDKKRKEDLDKELKGAEVAEKKKLGESVDAEKKKDNAEKKKEEAKKDVDRDGAASREKWDKKLADVLKQK